MNETIQLRGPSPDNKWKRRWITYQFDHLAISLLLFPSYQVKSATGTSGLPNITCNNNLKHG